MGAGTLNVTKLLDRIGTLATAVGGVQAVHQGKKVFDAATNRLDTVRALTAETQAEFNYDMISRACGANPSTDMGTVSVFGELKLNAPSNSSSDFNSAYELAEALFIALTKEANWNTGLTFAAKPKASNYSARQTSDVEKLAVLVFDFELNYEIGPIC